MKSFAAWRYARERMRRKALAARLAKVESENAVLDARRASGGATCTICGHLYRAHPEHPRFTFLTVLCDGDVVKL